MTILFSDGAGYICSNFVLDWLAQSGETIANLDKLTYADNLPNQAALNTDPRHVFERGTIGDGRMVGSMLAPHKHRAISKFAAESHVAHSIHGPGEFIQTNIVGTLQLLESGRACWGQLDG